MVKWNLIAAAGSAINVFLLDSDASSQLTFKNWIDVVSQKTSVAFHGTSRDVLYATLNTGPNNAGTLQSFSHTADDTWTIVSGGSTQIQTNPMQIKTLPPDQLAILHNCSVSVISTKYGHADVPLGDTVQAIPIVPLPACQPGPSIKTMDANGDTIVVNVPETNTASLIQGSKGPFRGLWTVKSSLSGDPFRDLTAVALQTTESDDAHIYLSNLRDQFFVSDTTGQVGSNILTLSTGTPPPTTDNPGSSVMAINPNPQGSSVQTIFACNNKEIQPGSGNQMVTVFQSTPKSNGELPTITRQGTFPVPMPFVYAISPSDDGQYVAIGGSLGVAVFSTNPLKQVGFDSHPATDFAWFRKG